MIKQTLKFLFLVHTHCYAYDVVRDCGAQPKWNYDATVEEAQLNAKAFKKCFDMANAEHSTDRTVIVSEGVILSTMPIIYDGLFDFVF